MVIKLFRVPGPLITKLPAGGICGVSGQLAGRDWTRRCAAAELGESGTDLAGVGVVELVQNGERFLPGPAGLVRVPGGELGVADVGEPPPRLPPRMAGERPSAPWRT